MITAWISLGFILGVVSIISLEGLVILIVLKKLSEKTKSAETTLVQPSQHSIDPLQSLPFLYQKQGVVWVLEPEKVPKIPVPVEQTRKNEILEVSPVRKIAKIKDRTLILIEADEFSTKILLKGCQIVAVSATSLPTRKWAKRYPIKVENKTATLYQGSKVFYIYAETSSDKESWCRALRLASSDDKDRLLWFSKLNEEFRSYLKSLAEGYPSLIKPSLGNHGGPAYKASRTEESPSKVRQIWRKFSRKSSMTIHDDKKVAERVHVPLDVPSLPNFLKTSKITSEKTEESCSVSSGVSSHSGSSAHTSEIADSDASEKPVVDEGTLCWNLLISRLFFDVKNNVDIKAALKARIQRTLSNMRTASYIGEVTCTGIDLGNLPPYIHGMRAIPTDMNDLWALEMDIEYSGGVVLYIEARLELPELDSHNGLEGQNFESSSVREETAELLEDFKQIQEKLKLSDGASDLADRTDAEDQKTEKHRNSKTGVSTSTSGSRWKAILNSVAKHVNQVPLTLAIRVTTLRGTVQIHVKPPPTDQLWFGFTSMPDIQFQLESSVKDHKITSGRVASFLISRFKASIKETLVLPNCESACISWMLAEGDDWLPRSASPLLWLNRDSPSDSTTSNELCNSQVSKQKVGDNDLEGKQGKQKKLDTVTMSQSIYEDRTLGVSSAAISRSSSEPSNSLSEGLRMPVLQNGESRDCNIQSIEENSECQSPSRYISLREERNIVEDDDGKAKRQGGRRGRMFDLGKKMSEKIEEKRRHIEEKSRHIVEKMRAP